MSGDKSPKQGEGRCRLSLTNDLDFLSRLQYTSARSYGELRGRGSEGFRGPSGCSPYSPLRRIVALTFFGRFVRILKAMLPLLMFRMLRRLFWTKVGGPERAREGRDGEGRKDVRGLETQSAAGRRKRRKRTYGGRLKYLKERARSKLIVRISNR